MAKTGDGGATFVERIREIIGEQLMDDVKEITNEKSFTEDLGADSLDVVELIMEFEDEFGIEISEEKAETLTTVGEAIAYLVPILIEKQNAS
jgi:acyl carrier protein